MGRRHPAPQSAALMLLTQALPLSWAGEENAPRPEPESLLLRPLPRLVSRPFLRRALPGPARASCPDPTSQSDPTPVLIPPPALTPPPGWL